ncbi:MAG: YraN family protein [Clostridia bacterium]|nr:YraN family protein [Clostridia bacterium]
MEKYNKILGNFGEDAAEKFLKRQGYKILERNYRCRFGEVDLVALEDGCLVFVEVKTRVSEKYGNPSNAVNGMKLQHMKKTALSYINYRRMGDYPARFDIAEVFADSGEKGFEIKKIHLIKNIFLY